jgi:hypothetical protein
MRTRYYKSNDFSDQFNNLTLKNIIQKRNTKEPVRMPEKTSIRFESLEDNFLQRMLELQPIVPSRYVWHVDGTWYDRGNDLRRFSISSQGLLCKYSKCKAVFANNGLTSIASFFPYVDDRYDDWMFRNFFRKDMTPFEEMLKIDFWRIDTHTFNGIWYIDPNIKNDIIPFENGESPVNYICTPVDIPPRALKMYSFNLDVYIKKLPKLMMTNSSLFPLSLLTPDDRVNEWIRRKQSAA